MVRNPTSFILTVPSNGDAPFLVTHGEWFAILGGLVIGSLVIVWQLIGWRRRRRIFSNREDLAEEEWFRRFCPNIEGRPLVRRVLEEFASEIGARWTQLRPTDRFERELRVAPRYLAYEDLNSTESAVIAILTEHAVAREEWPAMTGTLQEFLDALVASCRPPGPGIS